ncbi:related to triacylglycerol lipase V precursor [Rhynchosporium agropyri]|uniref:Carboxylic ester hydrolase n=1 Tax=Rhynchosporium agropyri TaxID=914238 RepID=A0A1E1KFA1_9HELO|nr:related to triacylglycerol lipase V precursor [Rhynchosporium agropyri]
MVSASTCRQLSAAAVISLALTTNASAACYNSSSPTSVAPRVTLDNRLTLLGLVNPSTPNVAEFLGIPYATAPVDELRWAPPQAYEPRNGTIINATATPPSCFQYSTSNPTLLTKELPGFVVGSAGNAGFREDCLTVSVYAPAEAIASNSSLPVIIWVYGGGFATGGQDVAYQIPSNWIERSQEHIVVSFNYRINIFGYPNAAGLREQNLGILDQRLAIEWAQANIAKFGGNPDQMTLWGHSAGSVAVDYYNFAYPSDPIVKGLIMNSGTAHLDQLLSPDSDYSNFTWVASNVGCANQTNAAAELACMRKVPAAVIEDFVEKYEDSGVSPPMTFAPIVDERIVFGNYTERAAMGILSTLPAIIGMDANEGMFLAPYDPAGSNQTIATQIFYAYFWCPATKSTYERLAANRTTYRHFYAGNFTNVSQNPWIGAYHSSELPLIFGTDCLNGESTTFEKEVSDVMQDAYLAFARDPVKGLEEVGWPVYESKGGLVREFAEGGIAAKMVPLTEIEDGCASMGLA